MCVVIDFRQRINECELHNEMYTIARQNSYIFEALAREFYRTIYARKECGLLTDENKTRKRTTKKK